jgi:hypothetical protein
MKNIVFESLRDFTETMISLQSFLRTIHRNYDGYDWLILDNRRAFEDGSENIVAVKSLKESCLLELIQYVAVSFRNWPTARPG